jgi:hypothetical protein
VDISVSDTIANKSVTFSSYWTNDDLTEQKEETLTNMEVKNNEGKYKKSGLGSQHNS